VRRGQAGRLVLCKRDDLCCHAALPYPFPAVAGLCL
jgi:hypothetical protein